MIPIDPSHVTPALKSLFDRNMPSAIRCFAVLEGGNAGKIFTDDIDHPTWGFVWEADDGTLFQSGTPDQDTLHRMVALLKQEGTVALGFRQGDPGVNRFLPTPDAQAACLEFDRPSGSSDLSPYLNRLPGGYEFHRMDQSLLERSPNRDPKIIRYGSIENLLEKGIAVCILHGTETVCEAYADMEFMAFRTPVDDFHIHQREIYWLCRVRSSESEFSLARLEKALRIQATFRNSTTVRKIATIFRGEL
jgi:hypothetical protein